MLCACLNFVLSVRQTTRIPTMAPVHAVHARDKRPMCTWSQLAALVLLEVLILNMDLFAIGRSLFICKNAVMTKHARQPVIFGHLHMAKTGGTALNGELALNFERVCGNKGYSYDAFQTNLRFNNSASHSIHYQNDSISKIHEHFYRGRVPPRVMNEIGYEDCDYISFESDWSRWSQFNSWDVPLELHVPCRSPVDHLMSTCNHRRRVFDCNNTDLASEIEKCLVFPNRFSANLESSFDNIDLKCFDFRKTFTEYIEYMGERLQRKRIQAQYVPRETNRPRKKTNECIWGSHFYKTLEAHLIDNYDYYSFCNRCIMSEDDLLA